jgi:hypothetical protein
MGGAMGGVVGEGKDKVKVEAEVQDKALRFEVRGFEVSGSGSTSEDRSGSGFEVRRSMFGENLESASRSGYVRTSNLELF